MCTLPTLYAAWHRYIECVYDALVAILGRAHVPPHSERDTNANRFYSISLISLKRKRERGRILLS